jgi:hypothetical protein
MDEQQFNELLHTIKDLPLDQQQRRVAKCGLTAWSGSCDKRLVCKFCLECRNANPTYAKEHLALHCAHAPSHVRDLFREDIKNNKSIRAGCLKVKNLQNEFVSIDDDDDDDAAGDSGPIFPTKRCAPAAGGFITTHFSKALSDAQVMQIDRCLAKWIFTAGLPFSTVDNVEFRAFISKLASTYWPKSSISGWTIRHQFLDEQYINIDKQMRAKVDQASTICLMSDGWSGVQRKAVVNILLTTPLPVFLTNVYVGTKTASAEFYTEQFSQAMAENQLRVSALCTDTAAVMRRTWSLMRDKHPGMLTYGCSCHVLQLLGKDVVRLLGYKDILKKCTNIAVWFRNHHKSAGLAQLREVQEALGLAAKSLSLPCATRWNSDLNCIESVLKCKQALRIVVMDDVWPRSDSADVIRTDVTSNEFFDQLKIIQKVLSPVKFAILALQHDEALLSDVYAAFVSLHAHFQALPQHEQLLPLLMKRCRSLVRDEHLCAFALDHRYNISEPVPSFAFMQALKSLAKNFARRQEAFHLPVGDLSECLDVDPADQSSTATSQTTPSSAFVNSCATSASTFSANISLFLEELELVRQKSSDSNAAWTGDMRGLMPRQWWRLMGDKWPCISSIARRLFELPASSSACERFWSSSDFILRKSRNRLSEHNADHLLSIYWNSRVLARKPTAINTFSISLEPSTKATKKFPHDMQPPQGSSIVSSQFLFESCIFLTKFFFYSEHLH